MSGFSRLVHGARAFVARFAQATRGNVAMMFGLALPALVMITLGAVDIHQASKVKANLQDALDAAALAAARSKYTDDVNLNRIGLAALKANMPAYFSETSTDTASFVLQGNTIIADARVNVKVLVANIVLPPYGQLLDDYLPVGSHSEVLRASRDVEVAMALDITGSMDNCSKNCPPTSKIQDLRAAAKELIELVVQDQQSPFYSKVALVPYAAGVNVGVSADSVRGALDATSKSITAASWVTGTIRTVSAVNRNSSATITASSHGFANGDRVVMWNIDKMPAINGVAYQVTNASSSQFQLRLLNSSGAVTSTYLNTSGYNSFSGTAYVAKCVRTDCGLTLTASGHGLVANDYVRLADMGGMAQLNNGGYRVASQSGSQVILDTSRSLGLVKTVKGGNSYSSGGKLFNGRDGGQWRAYPAASGMVAVLGSSTCVSERAGAQAYTDSYPSVGSYVGRGYLDSSNPCPSVAVTPLSSSRVDLGKEIDKLEAGGSTAGQIGIAWAWYMISPNFSSLWGVNSRPAAYDPSKTLKVAILMTDGEFNTPFRSGVIAADAGSGSGGADTHINENATNGHPFEQSLALCQAMQDQGVVVYTVGFDLGTDVGGPGIDTALEMLRECATTPDRHFFEANSGTDLKEAFKAIGRDITRLRIAR
ncbi:pilus assembly protein TadG-related protein [Brevundimonas pondensis]|uniref:Pilus assembly protein n=1 Tax=Brevundimonas pondensis TaxID=2774189 RepID=A0ABX7SJQ9_9CAUL|nr:pilus assembly protein TadG-related protein [Brevundimonas pondensis]QTC87248.1 pilus assembly protein [Brevundimonas pondensis]